MDAGLVRWKGLWRGFTAEKLEWLSTVPFQSEGDRLFQQRSLLLGCQASAELTRNPLVFLRCAARGSGEAVRVFVGRN